MNFTEIKYFLEDKGWTKTRPREGVIRYTSPSALRIEPPITIDVPDTTNTVELERYVPGILETLAQIYDLSVTNIGRMVQPPINCNTQLYTMEHVPPWMFKAVLPIPYFYFLPIPTIRRLNRFWFRWKTTAKYNPGYSGAKKRLYRLQLWLYRYCRPFKPLVNLFVIIHLYFLFIAPYVPDSYIKKLGEELRIFFSLPSTMLSKVLLLLFIFIYFKEARNLILFPTRKLIAFLGSFSGKLFRKTLGFVRNVAWFSFTRDPNYLLNKLLGQYPEGSGFMIHTVDFEFMAAGKPPVDFKMQVQELMKLIERKGLQSRIFPFLFIDPRRILKDPGFFKSQIFDHKVLLQESFVKDCFESYKILKFSGFKINPALGYYPFDEALLEIWKYAADNGIPVHVNCNLDALYYRGAKKKEWDYHPLFKELIPGIIDSPRIAQGKNFRPLLLPQVENREFTRNFIHPLNYLCLHHEPLLRTIVGRCNMKIQALFGYRNEYTPLYYNLAKLKICFSHYGGAEEWQKFMKIDTQHHYSNELLRRPNEGIDFTRDGKLNFAKLEYVWRETDWYSIISTLMLQYPNVYADISQIPNNPHIYSLFKMTMQNPKLRSKTLLGTDFYMTHLNKSERTVLAEIAEYLSSEELSLLFEANPRRFLGVV